MQFKECIIDRYIIKIMDTLYENISWHLKTTETQLNMYYVFIYFFLLILFRTMRHIIYKYHISIYIITGKKAKLDNKNHTFRLLQHSLSHCTLCSNLVLKNSVISPPKTIPKIYIHVFSKTDLDIWDCLEEKTQVIFEC